MTIAEEYAVFGLAAAEGNEPKFHIELVKFIIGQGWEIYHPKHKKTTGSKTMWARVLTVAFNRLSLSLWYRTVFAGLRVVAEGNNLYRFGSQMWTIGYRSQRHLGTRALQPLPQRPVLELPEELQANEDRGADRYALSDDEDDGRGAGAASDPRDALLSDDEDDGRGAGAASNPRDAIADDEHNGREIGSGLDLRRTELNEAIRRATELNFANMMDHLKTAVGSFHEQSQLAGQAKLEKILSNRDADAEAAELFVQNYKDKMMTLKADCVINMLTWLECKLGGVLSM
ncbi:hypothetical protein FN846DRAFT_890906 [Sphaerosporella brunnea]|uniref:Uncharacterized protein n=1 Tax=Sphaerosporella brunnea TaxID=1250544 RepID=A0A5J5EV93_9PEZI|nr:hypothetical protein FN846DRAFT_890906 [Sphaerosporella brunnea]